MGNRLSVITTKTGDKGTTGLGDGSRVEKTSPRIAAIGDVDELNCVIGLVLTQALPDSERALLTRVQHALFDLGGELSIPGYTAITESHIESLETASQRLNASLPPLKDFILPGGAMAAAFCHQARAVARRAERSAWRLAETETVSAFCRVYLNRLSDLLFILCRALNQSADVPDVLWQKALASND